MNTIFRPLALAALIGHSLSFVAQAQPGGYVETDLVVNRQVDGVPTLVDINGITHIAKFLDPNLVNPWGIAESGTSPFWIADGGAGVSTLYNTAGAPQPLIVSLPTPTNPLGATAPLGRRLQQRAHRARSVSADGRQQRRQSGDRFRGVPLRDQGRNCARLESGNQPGRI